MIKHLKPRSKEELNSLYKDLPPYEKLLLGYWYNMDWLKTDALKEGVNYADLEKYLIEKYRKNLP